MNRIFLPVFLSFFLTVPLFSDDNEFSLDVLKERYKDAINNDADIVTVRKPVPSKEKSQGELRLVTRNESRVIQTLVFSRYPSRFLKAMKEKEAIAWPIEMVGKGDSNLYMTGVELAIGYAKTQYPFRKDKNDKRKKLLMELVYSPKHCFAAFYMLEIEEKDGVPNITGRDLFSIVPLSAHYVKREQTLILGDAFEFDREKTSNLLGYSIADDSEDIRKAMEAASTQAEAASEEAEATEPKN